MPVAFYNRRRSTRVSALGPVYTKHKHQCCDNCVIMLAILFYLKTMKSLENGLQPQSEATPLFSMRTESLASSQSCHSVDTDAWCKWAFTHLPLIRRHNPTHAVRFRVALNRRYVADRVHELFGGWVVGWNVYDLTRIRRERESRTQRHFRHR